MYQQILAQAQAQTVIYMQERTLGQAFSLDTFIFSPSLADRGTKKGLNLCL